MTVLAKWHKGIVTQLLVVEDNSPKIKNLISQGFRIEATARPIGYTAEQGWLEFNVNDLAIIVQVSA